MCVRVILPHRFLVETMTASEWLETWGDALEILDSPAPMRRNDTYIDVIRREAPMARRRQDPKVEALRAERSLNPRPEAVTDERFASGEFFDARDLVQVKYEMVRRVRVDGDAVSRSVAAFGFSRPSFYAASAALDAAGLAGLVAARPGPRRAHKLTEEVVTFARARRAADPSLRMIDLVEAIAARFGVRVHPRSVERALARAARPKSGGGR